MIRPAQERLFGVIGRPVDHSLSPLMMNRAFQVLKLSCRYLAMEVTNPREDLPVLEQVGFEGLSVTVPHKEIVAELVSSGDDESDIIGAVNTLKLAEGGWVGKNTDWIGVFKALEKGRRESFQESDVSLSWPDLSYWKEKKALVVGAGGAARAVCYALKRLGVNITITNRTVEKGRKLADIFGAAFLELSELCSYDASPWEIIIQTTSVGMKEDKSLVPADLFSSGVIVLDIVYTPLWTTFLKEARRKGASVIVGLEMLLYQGAAQFEWWFDVPAPVREMRKVLYEGAGS